MSGFLVCASVVVVGPHRGPAEDDLLIMTIIHSGLSWLALVELGDCVFGTVEVFCSVPPLDFVW